MVAQMTGSVGVKHAAIAKDAGNVNGGNNTWMTPLVG